MDRIVVALVLIAVFNLGCIDGETPKELEAKQITTLAYGESVGIQSSWLSTPLTDASTGKQFKITDLRVSQCWLRVSRSGLQSAKASKSR